MKHYIVQPAEFVDNMSDDGHEGVKLPWHFTVTEDGDGGKGIEDTAVMSARVESE